MSLSDCAFLDFRRGQFERMKSILERDGVVVEKFIGDAVL